MTWTRRTLGGSGSVTDTPPADGQPNAMLPTALGLGAVAAVLLSLGSAIPVVADAAPGYSSTALLIVLAVLPIVLAAVFALRGRYVTAAGVLAGAAALAPGRAILDLQFLADPSAAARPELYRPEVFAMPGPAAGLWLLLAGHVATLAAGILGVRAIGPRPESEPGGRGLLLTGAFAATVAAVGVMMQPFSTNDAFLPVGSAFEGPGLVLAGCLVLAVALPVTAGLVTSSGTAGLTTGGLVGLAVAAVAVSLPNLVSGLVVDRLSVASGPVVVLVGAVALLVVAVRAHVADRGESASADGERLGEAMPGENEARGDQAGVANLPGVRRLWVATGVLAVLTGVLSLIGALTAQVLIIGDLPGPESPWRWLLFVAGLLTGVLGLAMFVPRLAANMRPALSVCWAGVPLAGTAVLTTAITATELRAAGLTPGPGVLWTAVAIVAAVATACCSVVAGMVERDNEDVAGGDRPGPNLMTPLVAGGILAIGGFGTPSILAPDYVEPALWSNFGTPSWGLLLALITVVGVCLLAPRCRPARAAALLAGATCLAGLRVAEYPLTVGVAGAHPGVGWWLALACAVALLIATAVAARPAKKPTTGRTTASRSRGEDPTRKR
ncbi:hypothetical protein [Amycolatopsis acididurans]|uniref:hypothetical protein n=1 Tax=Amycolatopsis acididurans TaxID=2724524 RepID=UPI001B33859F|nr:hypothetical protein [Amycolatopsis acididurans]